MFSSNRTFMELKLFTEHQPRFRRLGSNRTFMELKLTWLINTKDNYFVLIVPLWNWNMLFGALLGKGTESSNRTFMELKFRKSIRIICCKLVLIVPLWNWNYIFLHYCPLKIAKCSLKWLNISLLQKKIVRNDLRFIRHSSDRM